MIIIFDKIGGKSCRSLGEWSALSKIHSSNKESFDCWKRGQMGMFANEHQGSRYVDTMIGEAPRYRALGFLKGFILEHDKNILMEYSNIASGHLDQDSIFYGIRQATQRCGEYIKESPSLDWWIELMQSSVASNNMLDILEYEMSNHKVISLNAALCWHKSTIRRKIQAEKDQFTRTAIWSDWYDAKSTDLIFQSELLLYSNLLHIDTDMTCFINMMRFDKVSMSDLKMFIFLLEPVMKSLIEALKSNIVIVTMEEEVVLSPESLFSRISISEEFNGMNSSSTLTENIAREIAKKREIEVGNHPQISSIILNVLINCVSEGGEKALSSLSISEKEFIYSGLLACRKNKMIELKEKVELVSALLMSRYLAMGEEIMDVEYLNRHIWLSKVAGCQNLVEVERVGKLEDESTLMTEEGESEMDVKDVRERVDKTIQELDEEDENKMDVEDVKEIVEEEVQEELEVDSRDSFYSFRGVNISGGNLITLWGILMLASFTASVLIPLALTPWWPNCWPYFQLLGMAFMFITSYGLNRLDDLLYHSKDKEKKD